MLAGFVLGVVTAFLGSAIFSIILVKLIDVGNTEPIRVTAASQPLTMMHGDQQNSFKDTFELAVKNGSVHSRQNLQLRAYDRQPGQFSQNKSISQPTKDLVRKLLMAKMRLAGLNITTSLSDRWLEGYIDAKYASLAKQAILSQTKAS